MNSYPILALAALVCAPTLSAQFPASTRSGRPNSAQQGNLAKPIPPGPLGDLDETFVSRYVSRQKQIEAQAPPFVVVSGSSLVLYRGSLKESVRVIPDRYHALKDVAHVPFATYLSVVQTGEDSHIPKPSLDLVRTLHDQINAAKKVLRSSIYDPSELPRQSEILDASAELLSEALALQRVDSARLAAFASHMGPLMLENAKTAGCLQVQGTHKQMMIWKDQMAFSEWARLTVVNRGGHQARYRNAATQYFHWLFNDSGSSWSYPGESMRIIYAESLGARHLPRHSGVRMQCRAAARLIHYRISLP